MKRWNLHILSRLLWQEIRIRDGYTLSITHITHTPCVSHRQLDSRNVCANFCEVNFFAFKLSLRLWIWNVYLCNLCLVNGWPNNCNCNRVTRAVREEGMGEQREGDWLTYVMLKSSLLMCKIFGGQSHKSAWDKWNGFRLVVPHKYAIKNYHKNNKKNIEDKGKRGKRF